MKGSKPKKLLMLVREAVRRRHMSGRTEESYVSWIKRYIYFYGRRHPATMSEREVETLLMQLAVTKYRNRGSTYLSDRRSMIARFLATSSLRSAYRAACSSVMAPRSRYSSR